MSYYQRLQENLSQVGGEAQTSAQDRINESLEGQNITTLQDQLSAVPLRETQQAFRATTEDVSSVAIGKLGIKGIQALRGRQLGRQVAGAKQQSLALDQEADSLTRQGALNLRADRMTGKVPQNVRVRDTDVAPSDLMNDQGIGSSTKAQAFKAQNTQRAQNLEADDPGAAQRIQDKVEADPNYVANPQSSQQVVNNEFVKQQYIGDEENAARPLGGTGATPRTGQLGAGADEGTEVGDLPRSDPSQLGMDAENFGRFEEIGAERGALADTIAAGAKTAGDVALDAIPVVGEAFGVGYGLYEAIKNAHEQGSDISKQLINIDAAEAAQQTSEKFGLNRPNFGSMALPSADVSKNPSMLQE